MRKQRYRMHKRSISCVRMDWRFATEIEIIRYFIHIVYVELPLVWNKNLLFFFYSWHKHALHFKENRNWKPKAHGSFRRMAKEKNEWQTTHNFSIRRCSDLCVSSQTLLCIFCQFVVDSTLHSQTHENGHSCDWTWLYAVHLFLIRTNTKAEEEKEKNYLHFIATIIVARQCTFCSRTIVTCVPASFRSASVRVSVSTFFRFGFCGAVKQINTAPRASTQFNIPNDLHNDRARSILNLSKQHERKKVDH